MCFRPAAIEKPNVCPACGTANPPTNKKCRSCGEKLEHVIADNQGLNEEVAPPSAPSGPMSVPEGGASSGAPSAPTAPTMPQPSTPASPSAPTMPSSPSS